jgi:hypothetical protein
MKMLLTGSMTILLGVGLCAQSSDMKAMAQQFGQSAKANAAALRMYQPQIASWVDQKNIVFHAAISFTPARASQAALGTIQ